MENKETNQELVCKIEKTGIDDHIEKGRNVCYILFQTESLLMRTFFPKDRMNDIKEGNIISFKKVDCECKQEDNDLFPYLILKDFKIVTNK